MHCHQCFSNMNCDVDVGSVMFAEKNPRHQETHAKKTLKLVSLCSIPSWNFGGPGFWIHTKGIRFHQGVE